MANIEGRATLVSPRGKMPIKFLHRVWWAGARIGRCAMREGRLPWQRDRPDRDWELLEVVSQCVILVATFTVSLPGRDEDSANPPVSLSRERHTFSSGGKSFDSPRRITSGCGGRDGVLVLPSLTSSAGSGG